jgi:hypothetical protein
MMLTRYSCTEAPKVSEAYSLGTHESPIDRQKDRELQSSAPLVWLHSSACSTHNAASGLLFNCLLLIA